MDRATFLQSASKRRFATVTVPSVGQVRLRSITEKERAEYESKCLKLEDNDNGVLIAKRWLVSLCLCDDDGNALFTREDISELGDLDSQIIDALFMAARKHTESTSMNTLLGNLTASENGS